MEEGGHAGLLCRGRNFAHASTGASALSDEHADKTAHENRYGESSPGHCIPFRVRIFWKCLNPEIDEWVTIYTQVGVGLVIISYWTRLHAPNTRTATCVAHAGSRTLSSRT
eukprot:8549873-Pyramimonas_sp.AAC.1